MRITGTENPNESVSMPIGQPVSKAVSSPGNSGNLPSSGFGDVQTDSTQFSGMASLVSKIVSLPEISSGRVTELQSDIANGQFRIDSGAVATAVMHSMLDGAWS